MPTNWPAATFDLGLVQTTTDHPVNAESSFRSAIDVRESWCASIRCAPISGRGWLGATCTVRSSSRTPNRPTRRRPRSGAAELRQGLARVSGLERVQEPGIDQLRGFGDSPAPAGREADAIDSFSKAIDFQQQLVAANPQASDFQNDLAASCVDVGLIERRLERWTDAEMSFRRATLLREKLVIANPSNLAYRESLAWCYAAPGDRLAQDGQSRRRRRLRAQGVRRSRKPGAQLSERGRLSRRSGRQLLRSGAGATRKWPVRGGGEVVPAGGRSPAPFVRDNPTIKNYLSDLGASYATLGNAQAAVGLLDDAEQSLREAIRIRAKLIQDNAANDDYKDQIALGCRDLGSVLRKLGRMQDAATMYRAAVEIREPLAAANPKKAVLRSSLVTDYLAYGDALASLGNWADAAEVVGKAMRAGSKTWQSIGSLAILQLAAGDETGYRATCADLTQRFGNETAADARFAIVLALVLGRQPFDAFDQQPGSATEADPSAAAMDVLLRAAQCARGRTKTRRRRSFRRSAASIRRQPRTTNEFWSREWSAKRRSWRPITIRRITGRWRAN